MVDIAVILGANRERATRELMDSLEFEIKLANVSRSKIILKNDNDLLWFLYRAFTILFQISLPNEKRRNATLLYNPMTIAEMKQQYPFVDWKEYINNLLPPTVRVDDNEIVIVNVPSFISDLDNLLKKTPKRVQANYVMWRVAGASVSYLTDEIRKRQLDYSTALSGKTEREARWKECVDIVAGSLSISTGALYVRKYFREDAKANALEMVAGIRKQFTKILEKVSKILAQILFQSRIYIRRCLMIFFIFSILFIGF